MAQELKTSLVIDLAGNLQATGRRYIDTLRGIGRAGTEAGGHMEGGLQRANGAVNWLINRYTALGGVLAIGAIVHQVNKLGESFERLAGELGRPIEEIRALQKHLDEIAGRHDIVVETASLREASGEIARATRDLKFVKENAAAIGRALQVAGPGHESEVARMFTATRRQGITEPQAVAKAIDRLFAQSKTPGSAMSFEDVLGSGGTMAALLGSGRPGEEGMAEVGAVLQTAIKGKPGRGGTPGPEHARMTALAFFHELQSPRVRQKLRENGVQVLDAQGNQRPLAELIPEMARARVLASQENMEKIGFSEEAQGPLKVWGDELKRTGDIASFRALMAARGTGGMAEESANLATLPGVRERRIEENMKVAVAKAADKSITHAEDAVAKMLAGKTKESNAAMDAAIAALPGMEQARAVRSTVGRVLRETVTTAGKKAPDTRGAAAGILAFDAAQTRLRERLEREGAPAARPAAPQGKVTIEVRAAPGTSARVVGRPEAAGMDLDVDSGRIMTGN